MAKIKKVKKAKTLGPGVSAEGCAAFEKVQKDTDAAIRKQYEPGKAHERRAAELATEGQELARQTAKERAAMRQRERAPISKHEHTSKLLEALLQLRCIEQNGDWDAFIQWVHDEHLAAARKRSRPDRIQRRNPAPLPSAKAA